MDNQASMNNNLLSTAFIIEDYTNSQIITSEQDTDSSQMDMDEEPEPVGNGRDKKEGLSYFDEITSLSKMEVDEALQREAIQIPIDYFIRDGDHPLRQITTDPHEILNLQVSKEFNIRGDQISVNGENYPEVQKYLFSGDPFQVKPDSIQSGIIAGSDNFLVLIGSPNKSGCPGRLFIVYTQTRDVYDYKRLSTKPYEYEKTMQDIANYDKSFIQLTMENLSFF